MDAKSIQLIERLLFKKIILYKDLLNSLHGEKKSLMDIDLDRLWEISKEKEEICSKIMSVRQDISSIVRPEGHQESFGLKQIVEIVPREDRLRFHELYRTILQLKGEVEVLREENMAFIDDSLQFLDEMISLLRGEANSNINYNNKCQLNKSNANVILSREV